MNEENVLIEVYLNNLVRDVAVVATVLSILAGVALLFIKGVSLVVILWFQIAILNFLVVVMVNDNE